MGWRAPILTAILGAPTHPEDRRAYVEALTRFFDGPRPAAAYCVTALDRLMNKAVGLMGADSIFAALALYLSEQPGQGGWGVAALVCLVLAVGLLCTTLWATSAGISPDRMTEKAILDHGLRLIMGRTQRFTLALWLSGLAYVFLLVQIVAGLLLS